MKKFFALFLSAVLFTLTACAPQPEPEQTQPDDQQTEQIETNPVQNPQTEPEQTEVKSEQEQQPDTEQTTQKPQPLTLTQDNIYEVVGPALKACAQVFSGYPFSDLQTDDEGYTKNFTIEGVSGYTKSTQFKTIAELKQYYNTYLTPELYEWTEQDGNIKLAELPDGLYQNVGGHCFASYYPQSLTFVKQEGNIYHIAVAHTIGGDNDGSVLYLWSIFQGIIENDHFKIISRPENAELKYDFTVTEDALLFPDFGKSRL